MMGLSSAKEGHRPSVHSRFHSARVTNTVFRQSRSSVDSRCSEPALQAARQRGQEPPQDQNAAPMHIRSAFGSPGMRSGVQRGSFQTADDKVDAWDGAVAKQHEHANKTVLDGISAEKVADWDSKAAGNHEHDITELKQASGYIVFNCGSASLNI